MEIKTFFSNLLKTKQTVAFLSDGFNAPTLNNAQRNIQKDISCPVP